MTFYSALNDKLMSALALKFSPVAIGFTDERIAAHSSPSKAVAAGCQFWELGAVEAMVTSAQDHRNCSIGLYTHNLADAPATQQSELEQTLAAMSGLDYVRAAEVAGIPARQSKSKFVCYTPLAQSTRKPDVVLLFANARQGLTITEAITRVDGAHPLSLGRPACALIPQVINHGKAAASLGCCGARVYRLTR